MWGKNHSCRVMEPSTSAKVILHTSKGPVDLELWAKETPKTCRNFLQHCVNGYYNGTEFHRVIKNFAVQAGDPTNTGSGGQSIYETPFFSDEFHSRLRFSKRGVLAMANMGEPNTNGSQFIITLGPAPELNGKNTIFGRVVGDSFYNILQIASSELEDGAQDGTPLYPATIVKTEVTVPYFDDLVYTPTSLEHSAVVEKQVKKPAKRAIISYGGSDSEEEELVSFKMKPFKKNRKAETKGIKDEDVVETVTKKEDIEKDVKKNDENSKQTITPEPALKGKLEREAETLKLLDSFRAKMETTIELPSDEEEEELEDE